MTDIKKFLIFIAIVIIFGFSGLMVQNYLVGQKYAEAIKKVLELDRKTPKIDKNVLYETAKIKIIAMEAIDLRQCPPDFQQAYLHHIKTWYNALTLFYKLKYDKLSMTISILLGPIIKIYGSETEMQKAQKIDMEIHDSWSEIKLVSLKYGIQIGVNN